MRPFARSTLLVCCLLLLALPVVISAAETEKSPRQTISLDGIWEVAEGGLKSPPETFDRQVPVPGLLDMATPAFTEVGPRLKNDIQNPPADPRREAFWYRRTFDLPENLPEVARLKVHKAMFGTAVWLNGNFLGEHMPCFTPGWFDVRKAIKPGRNEVVIRVGASRHQLLRSQPDGFDFEKVRYIPGIYDSVELILAGTPFINNVQVAPDLETNEAEVVLTMTGSKPSPVLLEVREKKSQKLVARKEVAGKYWGPLVGTRVEIPNCHRWSPEDPFLYELTVRTAGDEHKTRFGMRQFKFVDRRAMLNGQPYYLRGNNITIHRFFEDAACGNLPWNKEWVRKLHRQIKSMNWNSLRYCIGFPPEFWYEIADEEGILIQDEFPIWYAKDTPKELSVDQIVGEYTEWMQERWNHPCVVIWDAQNETVTPKTGEALQRVRGLDFSNRPWDNGWSPALMPNDMKESHPYFFYKHDRRLPELPNLVKNGVAPVAPDADTGKFATIINEYDWLWLNRDGSPTTLSKPVYEKLLGKNSTVEQRRLALARYTATLTEYWRGHRQCAGVMQFVALGYARPDGQTCDYFLDVAKLEPEPNFAREVSQAFAPLGLMLNLFREDAKAGASEEISAVVINDLDDDRQTPVVLRLLHEGKTEELGRQSVQVSGLGTATAKFSITWPKTPGKVTLEAEIRGADGRPVHSRRDIEVR